MGVVAFRTDGLQRLSMLEQQLMAVKALRTSWPQKTHSKTSLWSNHLGSKIKDLHFLGKDDSDLPRVTMTDFRNLREKIQTSTTNKGDGGSHGSGSTLN